MRAGGLNHGSWAQSQPGIIEVVRAISWDQWHMYIAERQATQDTQPYERATGL